MLDVQFSRESFTVASSCFFEILPELITAQLSSSSFKHKAPVYSILCENLGKSFCKNLTDIKEIKLMPEVAQVPNYSKCLELPSKIQFKILNSYNSGLVISKTFFSEINKSKILV